MQHMPVPHEIYRHFKGNLYQIVTLAEHSETGEALVIYQALYGEFKTYARPLSMFMEKVDKVKYPEADQEYRFEVVKAVMERQEEPEMPAAVKDTVAAKVTDKDIDKDKDKDADSAEEPLNLDPMVIEFLDASTYEERLNILAGLHHRITDDMINVMAMATDIEVKPGDVEERYIELRNCLMTLEKFECNRLR